MNRKDIFDASNTLVDNEDFDNENIDKNIDTSKN